MICLLYFFLDTVVGAGFTGMYYDEILPDLVLTTSPTISTIEKLNTGDQIWITIGRKQLGSALASTLDSPVHFSVKLIPNQIVSKPFA
jgi:hypothetical protein